MHELRKITSALFYLLERCLFQYIVHSVILRPFYTRVSYSVHWYLSGIVFTIDVSIRNVQIRIWKHYETPFWSRASSCVVITVPAILLLQLCVWTRNNVKGLTHKHGGGRYHLSSVQLRYIIILIQFILCDFLYRPHNLVR